MSASPEHQANLVAKLLREGVGPTEVARYVGWPVEAVRKEAARLKAEKASGIALAEPESPQRPLAAPTAVATPAVDAEVVRPAENPPQVTPQQGVPARRRLGPAAPAPRRGLLDWLAPRDGDAPVRTPWRKVAAWAGGVAAAVVLASLTMAPHGGTAATTGTATPTYYRCTLPGGAVVMTTSQAECASDVASIPQAQPTVPTVATIPPYTPPASTVPTQPPAATPPATTPAPQTPTPAPQPAPSAPSDAPGPVFTPGHGLTIVGGTSAQPSAGVRAAECAIERLPKGAGNGC